MSSSNIALQSAGDGIALVTIGNPGKMNALNAAAIEQLDFAVNTIESDRNIRAMIVTGAGEKAFVAGADIQELVDVPPVLSQQLSLRGQRVFRRIETMSKPSVAAVNGFALGAGLELAMACTLRVAVRGATLGLPEVKLGLITGYGGSQRLPRLVGRGRALEMLLTGEPVAADAALQMGLVNRVVDAGEAICASRELLLSILRNGPVAVGLTMQAVDMGLNAGLEEGQRFEAAAFGIAAGTRDRAEGTRAFLEKRAPVFTGN